MIKKQDDRMVYKIIKINEPDFGCEGLPEGAVRMDEVYLQDARGETSIVEIPDAFLYEMQIDEGDDIAMDAQGVWCKVSEQN